MKHLCLISLTWALVFLALAVPKYIVINKQLDYAIKQQKQIQQQLDLKKAELDLLQKLSSEANAKPSSKKPGAYTAEL